MGVNMTKGQKISLEKPGGGTLTRVRMGLGWDVAQRRGLFGKMREQSIDLDASCLLFGTDGRLVDQVWYGQLDSRDRSVHHTGDNLTGAGDGDDEVIEVDLTRVPVNVKTLVFTVNSFTGQSFSQVENAFCRLVDDTTGAELARYTLSEAGSHTAQIMAKVTRDGSGWTMTAIGATTSGRTVKDLVPAVTPHI